MKRDSVVRWLKAGYPYFKEGSGIPAWIVPEHTFDRFTDELGDESILEICRPLQVADGIEELVDRCRDPEMVPAEMWRMAVTRWPAHTLVKPTTVACLHAAASILSQFQQGRLAADPLVVCRALAVLGYAPFVPAGGRLLQELVSHFQGDVGEPAHLVKKYVEAVSRGDAAFIEKIDDCIQKHSYWMEWATRSLQRIRDIPYTPKPIGVTPPLSGELISVLVQMMKEVG